MTEHYHSTGAPRYRDAGRTLQRSQNRQPRQGVTSDAERPFVRRDAEGLKVMPVVHRDEVAGGRPARTGHGEPVGMALRSQ